jgi:hypothetical protein
MHGRKVGRRIIPQADVAQEMKRPHEVGGRGWLELIDIDHKFSISFKTGSKLKSILIDPVGT